MDELRRKYRRGQIDKVTYQEKLTELTIFHLKSIKYKYVGKIAEGAHGVVVEMKSPETVLNVAVKIIFDDFEVESGLMSWPKLIHENILPLLTWRVIWQTNSKAFVTIKYDKTLKNKISSFRCDYNGFEKAVNSTRDIMNAVNYLHHQELCHLNIGPDRILVDYNNKVKLGGFSYLTPKDSNNVKFGTAAVFRPPEVYPGTNRKVDGEKFDVWSLGVLAIETFTGEYMSKEMSKWQAQPETWHMQLYGLMYEVLEKETFNELVKKHIPNWKADDEKLDQVNNFIKSCLIFNLEDRPSIDDLLKLKLFGGNVEKYCPKEPPDLWAEMVDSMDLIMTASEKRNINMSDNDYDTSDYENVYNEKLSDSGLQIKDATVENDTEFCVESNSVKIYASEIENLGNSKVEEKENCFVPDEISDETKIKDDKNENNEFDETIDSKLEESFNFPNSGQTKILDYKHLHDDIENKTNERKGNVDDDIVEMNNSMNDKNVKEKIKETDIGDIMIEGEEKKYETEFDQRDDDMNGKVEINDMKEKYEKIELGENDLEDVNISNIDRDVEKDETASYESDTYWTTKERASDMNEKSEIKEMKENVLANMSNNDGDVKENKSEDGQEKEHFITENKKYEINTHKNFDNVTDIDHSQINIIDAGNNTVESTESVQYELNSAPVFISNTPETLTDSFEAKERKKKLKRRKRRKESEKNLNTSTTDIDAKPERRNLEARKRRKKRSNQSLFKGYETVCFSNENSLKHNMEVLEQRSRLNLNTVQPYSKKYFQTSQECSLKFCEKRDDTNRKERLLRKTYTPKSMIDTIVKSPATSSLEDHKSVRESYSPEIVRQKIMKSPATLSSKTKRSMRNTYMPRNMRTIQEDGNDELEPGEIPIFRKDYDKILDKQGPEYSVASLSDIFIKDDDDDLEEGEIDPHNPGSIYDSKPQRIRRRFKHLRSWWKRQKKNMTSCFTACFCARDTN